MTRRLPDLRATALKAYRLSQKNITGEELAARLNCGREKAADLAYVGSLIKLAEDRRLTERQFDVLKVIARTIARTTMLGRDWVKPSDVDFAAGKRSGWCSRSLVSLTAAGLVRMVSDQHLSFTRAGWALVWEAKLIKPNWKVPA
jgi:hypothetical protein